MSTAIRDIFYMNRRDKANKKNSYIHSSGKSKPYNGQNLKCGEFNELKSAYNVPF